MLKNARGQLWRHWRGRCRRSPDGLYRAAGHTEPCATPRAPLPAMALTRAQLARAGCCGATDAQDSLKIARRQGGAARVLPHRAGAGCAGARAAGGGAGSGKGPRAGGRQGSGDQRRTDALATPAPSWCGCPVIRVAGRHRPGGTALQPATRAQRRGGRVSPRGAGSKSAWP